MSQPSQPRYFADAFSIRAVTGDAGGYVRLRNAALIDRFAAPHEASIAVIGGSRRQLRKIDCQVMDALGTEAGGRAPHILLCKRAIARSLGETDQLLLDISGPLAGKAGRRRVSLRGSAMAPGAIADGRTFAVTGRYRNGDRSERQDSDFQCSVFHGSSYTL